MPRFKSNSMVLTKVKPRNRSLHEAAFCRVAGKMTTNRDFNRSKEKQLFQAKLHDEHTFIPD